MVENKQNQKMEEVLHEESQKVSEHQDDEYFRKSDEKLTHDVSIKSRLVSWTKLIAMTGIAQILVQTIGFISGILIVRLLSSHEYALYTIANSVLGTISVLADGGISTGVMAQGGKVYHDKYRLGDVLVTGIQLRKQFVLLSLIIAIPVLIYLIDDHGATWAASLMIAVAIIPTLIASITGPLLEIAPKLQQQIKPIQKIQITANIGRLAIVAIALLKYPTAASALFASGMGQLWANWRLKHLALRYADLSGETNQSTRDDIKKIVKRILPGTIYYAFNGQISVWLASILGNTASIAQIGALSRLSILIAIFTPIIGTLVVPRFARLPKNRRLILSRFLLFQLLIVSFCCLLIVLTSIFAGQILLLLGNEYAGLEHELVLMTITTTVSLVAGSIYSISVCRGNVINPIKAISFGLATQVVSFYIINPGSVSDIFMFSTITNCANALSYCVYFIKKA